MDPLDTFKAVLEQHEQTRNENVQLRQEIAEFQDEVRQLRNENDAVRRVIQYGQQLVSKNRKRDEAMQETFADVLDRASMKSDTTQQEDTTEQATLSALEQLTHEIGLVADVAADGSLSYCEASDLPPLVKSSIVKNVEDAQAKRDPRKKLMAYFTSKYQCAAVALIGDPTYWVDGKFGKFACRRCFKTMRACVVFDPTAQKLAVQPLPPAVRGEHVPIGSDEYYITTLETKQKKDGPWSKKETRAPLRVSEKRKRDD